MSYSLYFYLRRYDLLQMKQKETPMAQALTALYKEKHIFATETKRNNVTINQ